MVETMREDCQECGLVSGILGKLCGDGDEDEEHSIVDLLDELFKVVQCICCITRDG